MDERSALLISSSDKSTAPIASVLKSSGLRVTVSSNGGEGRRATLSADFDVVLVNAPLSDEFGHELCITLAEKSAASVLLLVRAELLDDMEERLAGCGVFTAGKPITGTEMRRALHIALAARDRTAALYAENRRLTAKLEEARAVGRAKCLLIEYQGMSEHDAHKRIEKEAMDRGLTRRTVAEEIISSFG